MNRNIHNHATPRGADGDALKSSAGRRPTTDFNSSQKNRRILIVDDNTAIHTDYLKLLSSARSAASEDLRGMKEDILGDAPKKFVSPSYEIDSAYQGKEALALVHAALMRDQPYALAFVDMRMPPGWDGLETISRIWAVDPDLQIVICTAHADYSWVELVTKLGQSDRLLFLKKPFHSAEVRQLALAMTEKWSVTDSLKRHLGRLGSSIEASLPARNETSEDALLSAREQLSETHETIRRVLASLHRKGHAGEGSER